MGPYRVIVADPPWQFGDKLPGPSRGAERNYRTMDVVSVCLFDDFHEQPVADDAVLFLWRVSAMAEEAHRVVRAWGFEYKTEVVWRKLTKGGKEHFGMGRIVRAAHEVCLVARRGRPQVKNRSTRSTFETEVEGTFEAVVGRHSEKPEEFFAIVESLFDGPYLELFGRRRREGWTVLGDEVPGGG